MVIITDDFGLEWKRKDGVTNKADYDDLIKAYELLGEITETEAKSMICTLDMFKRLAFNVHGVIDVIDDKNIEKMREILSLIN